MTTSQAKELEPLKSEEYAVALNVLKHTSKHIAQITDYFTLHILPELKTRNRLLDIGSGDGTLTEHIASHFVESTVVEPNPLLKDILFNKGFVTYSEHFNHLNLDSSKKFDFILISHVLYHMQQAKIDDFLEKAYSLLAPGGMMLIVMMAPRGENHHLHYELNPYYINSANAITALDRLGISYKQTSILNKFMCKDRNEMRTLIRFFALDDCLPKDILDKMSPERKSKIAHMVETQVDKCKDDAGESYSIEQEEDYLLVKPQVN